MSRFADRLKAGELAVGSLDTLGSPRLVEVMAAAGIDMVLIDQMFCPTDWETVAGIVRAARNYGVDTMVRLAGFPWMARTDNRIAVDAVRALGVGATGVMASCATVEEVEQLVEVSRDWHRDIHIHDFADDQFDAYAKKVSDDCVVMPMIESASSIDRTSEIIRVAGLKALSLGLTDISRVLGKPFDYEHSDVVSYIQSTVRDADRQGVAVGANLGYTYSRSVQDMASRARRLKELGLRFLWLQNNGFVIQWMYRSTLKAIATEAKAPRRPTAERLTSD